MTDEEYVKHIGELYQLIVSRRSNDDYEVNHEQMRKYIDVVDFFTQMVVKSKGKMEAPILVPRECHGGVTATFKLFDIVGDDIEKFSKVILNISAMTIDETIDGFCISVTVPNVYVERNRTPRHYIRRAQSDAIPPAHPDIV